MPQILHCSCGHQLTLTDEEMGELIWCPRCRKVVVQPSLYNGGERSITKPASSAHLSQPLGPQGMSGVLIGGLAILFAIVASTFLWLSDHPEPRVPSSSPRRFGPQLKPWNHQQPVEPLLGDPPRRFFDQDPQWL